MRTGQSVFDGSNCLPKLARLQPRAASLHRLEFGSKVVHETLEVAKTFGEHARTPNPRPNRIDRESGTPQLRCNPSVERLRGPPGFLTLALADRDAQEITHQI